MRTIAGDIHTWSCFYEPPGYNFNGFLISAWTGNLAIDPVEPSDQGPPSRGSGSIRGRVAAEAQSESICSGRPIE